MSPAPIIVVAIVVGVAWFLIVEGGLLGNLSYSDLVTLAENAGFNSSDAQTAAAIALAESSGNPDAIGDTSLAPSNGPSIGLWQINIGSSANPQYANSNLKDPGINAAAAFEVFQSAGGFSPWSTYNNGAYQKYLGA